jgi:hypothetical protein
LGLQNGDSGEAYDVTDVFGGEAGEGLGLVERVTRVWETSERVGGKVRRLDEEISRVREATDIVTEVLELKVSDKIEGRDNDALRLYALCCRPMIAY